MVTKHWQYLKYVVRHKWYVFWECLKLRVPLWRALLHDWDKFLPALWFPYVEHFYGESAQEWRSATGYYKPTDTGDAAFDFAIFLHLRRNDHHWQWWLLPEDIEGVKVLPMSDVARREMLADWRGAGKAQKRPDTAAWYVENGYKLQLHPETRAWVEKELGVSAFERFYTSSGLDVAKLRSTIKQIVEAPWENSW